VLGGATEISGMGGETIAGGGKYRGR